MGYTTMSRPSGISYLTIQRKAELSAAVKIWWDSLPSPKKAFCESVGLYQTTPNSWQLPPDNPKYRPPAPHWLKMLWEHTNNHVFLLSREEHARYKELLGKRARNIPAQDASWPPRDEHSPAEQPTAPAERNEAQEWVLSLLSELSAALKDTPSLLDDEKVLESLHNLPQLHTQSSGQGPPGLERIATNADVDVAAAMVDHLTALLQPLGRLRKNHPLQRYAARQLTVKGLDLFEALANLESAQRAIQRLTGSNKKKPR